MTTFTIGEADFLLDGQRHRIVSGAIHYFRVHPDQWADRIHKARLMGLNAIETYVAWNVHEPRRGEWNTTGWNDLGAFLDLIAAEGMHAIVRPGPYICAEWHNGGLPVWLTAMPGIRLRSCDPVYLREVTTYLNRVYDILAPRQIDRAGPVILVQIENEYGAYGSDAQYLRELVDITRASGITVPLTTVDQPMHDHLRNGSLAELHATGSFGSRVRRRLATLREHQPTGPLMCSEFWDGWFDWWGGRHHTTDTDAAAGELDELLFAGASVNIYMFHGGTNFGLTNGANHKGRYLPIVTSYDYDAPLDEAGNPTAKYWEMRDILASYVDVPAEKPAEFVPSPGFDVPLSTTSGWAAGFPPTGALFQDPPTFEQLEHLDALVAYETVMPADAFSDGEPQLLHIDAVRDRAWVCVDGRPVGVLSRSEHKRTIAIPPGRELRLLVEQEGRLNYADRIGESKGIIGEVSLAGRPLRCWSVSPISLAAVAQAAELAGDAGPGTGASTGGAAGPVALRGDFTLEDPHDLFLDTAGWGKGFAFVNGLMLGRYWSNGPQRTLYVPAPATKKGPNTVVIVELEYMADATARFVDRPILGPEEE